MYEGGVKKQCNHARNFGIVEKLSEIPLKNPHHLYKLANTLLWLISTEISESLMASGNSFWSAGNIFTFQTVIFATCS